MMGATMLAQLVSGLRKENAELAAENKKLKARIEKLGKVEEKNKRLQKQNRKLQKEAEHFRVCADILFKGVEKLNQEVAELRGIDASHYADGM